MTNNQSFMFNNLLGNSGMQDLSGWPEENQAISAMNVVQTATATPMPAAAAKPCACADGGEDCACKKKKQVAAFVIGAAIGALATYLFLAKKS